MSQPTNEEEYKKQLLNRQIYTVGAEAQKKYAACDVLVVGLTGCGLELVKNLVLSGVRSVTIVDDANITHSDLSSLFFASPADVGKPRATTLVPKICELNRFVKVSAAPGDENNLSDELLKAHTVAVFVDKRTTLLTAVNTRCRHFGVKMVCCESRGVACSIFVDGGAQPFTVLDKNGEECVLCVVADMTSDGVVYMSDDKKHELEVGDLVYFLSLPGVHGQFLNSTKPSSSSSTSDDAAAAGNFKTFKVTNVLNPYTIQIELPEGWKEANVPQLARGGGNESVGGFLQTTKVSLEISFKSLEEAVVNPDFFGIIDDDPKLAAEYQLHPIFRAIHAVAERIHSDNVTNALDEVMERGAAIDTDINKDLLRTVASAFHGNLNPMATFVGGIAAQEVLKLASGKYKPIQQWFYFDQRELVDLRPAGCGAAEFAPRNNRYDGQVAVIGNTVQQKLLDASCFVVGAGALGCEHVKNIAMMGVGCGGGCVTVTDMDNIELSNLSRQFLFRQKHVGSSKSFVATQAAKEMNTSLNIVAKELKVGPDTDNVFNENFWGAQTAVLNALDNVPARLYVDEQCLNNQKPLFESGTNGPKLNTQCVIPFLTENYGATRDPPEKEFALCTLKNFPNAIEHTIHWAKEAFGTEFTSIPSEVMSFVHSNAQWRAAVQRDPSAKAGAVKQIVDALRGVPQSWADCVAWARNKFEDYFVNEIKQLMYNLPLGSERDGKPVWGGAKRPPTPAVFDSSNPMHLDFILAAASLRAVVYGIQRPKAADAAIVAELPQLLKGVSVPEWKPRKQDVSVKDDEQKDANSNSQDAASGSVTEAEMPEPSAFHHLKLSVQEFEKDDDTNFHVDFMTAVSNLRATNYGIPVVSRDHTKFVAGRIIPAMITTTACATGLVGLEFLKYMMGIATGKELGLVHFRNAFMNLAVPLFNLTPPTAAAKANAYTTSTGREIAFTNWDRIDIGDGSRDMTLAEIVAFMKDRYDIEVDMLSTSTAKLLYTGPFTKKERMHMGCTEVLAQLGCPVKDDAETVTLIANGTCNDEDVDIPAVVYRFRGARK